MFLMLRDFLVETSFQIFLEMFLPCFFLVDLFHFFGGGSLQCSDFEILTFF